ncbi:hypothetical protein Leryth_017388 [Lithospermum erythrorhizon]|nr:hypothetical protein Leryth_017388 [Lithospermum erythrorhizon]
MTSVGINADSVNMDHLIIQDQTTCVIESQTENVDNGVVEDDGSNVQVTCFSDTVDNATFHFQIIRLQKQIYAWIGCDSAKFGNLYAAAPTRPSNTVSVASLIGGTSDNTGSSIARRLVLRTGLPIVLSSNIPKNNTTLEADAEKKLIQKLISLVFQPRHAAELDPDLTFED